MLTHIYTEDSFTINNQLNMYVFLDVKKNLSDVTTKLMQPCAKKYMSSVYFYIIRKKENIILLHGDYRSRVFKTQTVLCLEVL